MAEAGKIQERILGLRKKAGLTKTALAERLTQIGYPTQRSQVGHLESGRTAFQGRWPVAYKAIFFAGDELGAFRFQKLVDAQYPPETAITKQAA